MVDQSHREAHTCIPRPTTCIVYLDPMFEIGRPAGVVRAVGTFNDVTITGQFLPQPVMKLAWMVSDQVASACISFFIISVEIPSICAIRVLM